MLRKCPNCRSENSLPVSGHDVECLKCGTVFDRRFSSIVTIETLARRARNQWRDDPTPFLLFALICALIGFACVGYVAQVTR